MALLLQLLIESFSQSLNGIFIQLGGVEEAQHDGFG
jgi:hypothetical protein